MVSRMRKYRAKYILMNNTTRWKTIQSYVHVFSGSAVGQLIILAGLFLVVFTSHFSHGVVSAPDSKWSIYTAMSIIREGNTSLDEYSRMLERENYYAIETINGHSYTMFPVGSSFLAVPIVFILDQFLQRGLGIDLEEEISQSIPTGIETFVASLIVALTTVFIYLIGCLVCPGIKYPLFLAWIFAFCTSAWSTASRALWQHGPSMCLLTISFYLLLLTQQKPKYAGWLLRVVSLPLAFSYVVRPTNSISIVVFTLWILIGYRKHFLSYCLWGMIIAIPFFVFNWLIYDSLFSPYYLPQRLGSHAHFFEALAGNLVSPARGLLVFSPLFLFSGYGILLKLKRKHLELLDYALLLIIILHWIAISSFPHWWGGFCFGPRFFSDMLPFLLYFLIPVFQELFTSFNLKRASILIVFLVLVAISFLIHRRGATSLGPFVWNFDPVSLDEHPSRLWDWRDIQFLRPNYVYVDEYGNIHR